MRDGFAQKFLTRCYRPTVAKASVNLAFKNSALEYCRVGAAITPIVYRGVASMGL